MAPLRLLTNTLLLLAGAAHAHFSLSTPPALSNDESTQPNGPCGADLPSNISEADAADFHVDGDYISLQLGHPQAHWLFRATLDPQAAGNWSQLWPIVLQSGRGNYCQPKVTAPKEFAGQRGYVGIAANAPDGILFQCAVVDFVAGAAELPDSGECTNASSVTGDFDADQTLTGLMTGGSGGSNPDSAATMLRGRGASVVSLVVALAVGAAVL